MNQTSKGAYIMSPSQVMSMITSTTIGVGVLTLPRTVTQSAHQAGWISVLVGGLLSMAVLWTIVKVGQKYPHATRIHSGSNTLLANMLAMPSAITFVLFWILTTAGTARTFGEVVVTAVLVKTPLEVIVWSMLIAGFILVMYDIEVMVRVHETLLPILVIPLLVIAILAFQSAEFIRLMPLFSFDWKGLFIGVMASSFAYQGYEHAGLYLEHINFRHKESRRAAILGLVYPMMTYVLIVIAGIASFGYEELQRLMWPTLELVKTTEVPGLILERLESAFLGVWVAAVFTTVGSGFFSSCYALKKLMNIRSHRYIAIGLLPVLYFLAMWPDNVHQLFQYLKWVALLGMILNLLTPVILWVLGMVQQERAVSQQGDGQP
ncbi:UNVERIFIED_CONTAM: spore germination protein [Brevibacillus sp. OAP136]